MTGLAPKSGPDTGGTSVVVSGENFAGVRSVWFGAVAAESFTVSGDTVTAVSLVAELHDFRRFRSARALMAYLGLVPSEHSSGEQRRQVWRRTVSQQP